MHYIDVQMHTHTHTHTNQHTHTHTHAHTHTHKSTTHTYHHDLSPFFQAPFLIHKAPLHPPLHMHSNPSPPVRRKFLNALPGPHTAAACTSEQRLQRACNRRHQGLELIRLAPWRNTEVLRTRQLLAQSEPRF